MPRNPRKSNQAAIASCNAQTALIGAGGLFRVYTGPDVPTDLDVPLGSQYKLLSEHACSNPAFAPAVDANPNAEAVANPIATSTPILAGPAKFCRFCQSDGTPVIQGDIGTADADAIVANINFTTNIPVAITSYKYRVNE